MGVFNNRKREKRMLHYQRKRKNFYLANFHRVFILILICQLLPVLVEAKEKEKLAVLPFKVHSLKPMDHLKKKLQEMFTVRMAEKGLDVIDPELVNKNSRVLLQRLKLKDITIIGKNLGANWLISGNLTVMGRKISLDLKVIDISAVKPPFSIFMVEDDIDKLSDSADRATTSIYNQIAGVVQIDSIRVKGNKRIESDAILAVVSSKKGEGIDNDQLNKDLRTIFKMGFFKDVNMETEDGPKGKIVSFIVKEKSSITRISFNGNKKMKDDDLQEEFGIKLYSILNRNETKQGQNRLKEYYRGKGYYNAGIREKIEELPNNEVALTYDIKEGKKVYIRSIRFIGNSRFDDGDLKKIMETSESAVEALLHRAKVNLRKNLGKYFEKNI